MDHFDVVIVGAGLSGIGVQNEDEIGRLNSFVSGAFHMPM
jgi:hypothetical protein